MSVINRVVNKLSQDGSESLACARAPGLTNANGYYKYSGEYKPNHACAREVVCASRAGGRFTEAEVEAWRERIFGESLEDPVKVAVEEAIKSFGSAGDFTLWAWYANRIGVNNFIELLFEQQSIMRDYRLRNPAAAFHARLRRFYIYYFADRGNPIAPKGGRA